MIEAQPSRTALRVALRRAAHQLVDAEPLVFRDAFAVRILGPELDKELQRTPKSDKRPFSANLRAWMVARARFAEDVLAAVVREHGAVQYLVLGAGLDTFALRNPYPQVRVFEVDHPATQAWKREHLAAAALVLPGSARLVAVDFEQQSLTGQLLEAGFDFRLPTATAWLGVVPYLTAEAFAATARVLGGFAPGSQVVFDYGQPREVLSPVEQQMHDSLASRVAQVGEPFQLSFTPAAAAEALAEHGLQVVEDLGSAELNARFFTGRTDGLALRGSGGRLGRAAVR